MSTLALALGPQYGYGLPPCQMYICELHWPYVFAARISFVTRFGPSSRLAHKPPLNAGAPSTDG